MLGDFERAPQQAHGDPAPLSAKAYPEGEDLFRTSLFLTQVKKSVLLTGSSLDVDASTD